MPNHESWCTRNQPTNQPVSNAKSSLYADASTFDYSGHSAKEVLKVLQSSLLQANTCTWLNTNCLDVNASKSSFMLLGNTKNSDYLQDIILKNVKLEHTSSSKLLGLHIQTDVAWKEHITSVAKSLSSKIGLFIRLSKFLKFDILCKFYFTLVVPCLDFCTCINIWGNSPATHTDILQKLQKRLARINTKLQCYVYILSWSYPT